VREGSVSIVHESKYEYGVLNGRTSQTKEARFIPTTRHNTVVHIGPERSCNESIFQTPLLRTFTSNHLTAEPRQDALPSLRTVFGRPLRDHTIVHHIEHSSAWAYEFVNRRFGIITLVTQALYHTRISHTTIENCPISKYFDCLFMSVCGFCTYVDNY
jgi:hypothetical protein